MFAVVVALGVAGCSSGSPGQGSDGFVMPSGPVTVPTENPEPGSIESVRQDLSDECAAAVQGLRDLMVEYPSVLDVPYDGTYDEAFAAGRQGCPPEEFRRFHDRELLGWIYAR
jgi:hypothetical protein